MLVHLIFGIINAINIPKEAWNLFQTHTSCFWNLHVSNMSTEAEQIQFYKYYGDPWYSSTEYNFSWQCLEY
jgi:hypothetical protein